MASKRKRVLRDKPPRENASLREAVAPKFEVTLSNKKLNQLICICLVIVVISAYAPVVTHPFVNYDDDVYIVSNPNVRVGLSWYTIRLAFTTYTAGNWHPVTMLSHLLDCQLFGLYGPGHHLTSLFLHMVNVVLLFLLLVWVTGRRIPSLIVAGLFALHPFNVESVAWIAERKNLICTMFFLLALCAYSWYAQRPQVKRYLLVTAFFILGLASKPMVITLPFVFLLVDFWPLGRIEGWTKPGDAFPVPQFKPSRLILEKVPLLVLCVASGVITLVAQRSASALAPTGSLYSISWRLGNAVHSYAVYIWRAFVPRGLAVFYPAVPLTSWQVGSAAAFLATIIFVVWKMRHGRPYLPIGLLWFFGILVPAIGLVQVGSQAMADRYTYIPLIGIFIAVVWLADDLAQSRTRDVRWLLAAWAPILIILFMLTRGQLSYWRSSEYLWNHDLAVTRNNYAAQQNLGVFLESQNREEEAYPHFLNVLAIIPDQPIALVNVGNYLIKHEKYEEAISAFHRLIDTSKDPSVLVGAYRGLGVAYAHLGDIPKARQNLIHAFQLGGGDSSDLTDLLNLSVLEAEDSIKKMNSSLSKHPSAEGYLELGRLLQDERKIPDAQAAFEQALHLDPTLAEAKHALRDLRAPNPTPSNP